MLELPVSLLLVEESGVELVSLLGEAPVVDASGLLLVEESAPVDVL